MPDSENTLNQNIFEDKTLHKKDSKYRKQVKAVSLDWKQGDVVMDLYKVKGELGVGGFGKVFHVFHKKWKIILINNNFKIIISESVLMGC